MKNIIKKTAPYLIFFIILFYGLGFALPFETAPILLMLFYPIFLIGAGIFYTVKHGFKWYFLVAIPLLFLPACFIFYNDSALFYVFAYFVILAIGQGIGSIVRLSVKNRTQITKKTFFLFMVFSVLSGCFTGCARREEVKFNPDFMFGVIESTEQKNLTYITYYDEQLQKLSRQKIDLGGMSTSYAVARVIENSMFIVPTGLGGKKELTCVMELDMKTGKVQKHEIGQRNITAYAVSEQYILTACTWNAELIIGRYNRQTKTVDTLTVPDSFISRFDCHDGVFYCFAKEGKDPYLYLIEPTDFAITEKIELKQSGGDQYYTYFYKDNLYFASNRTANDYAGRTLSRYNIITKKIENISLQADSPFQLLPYKNKLLITHNFPATGEGNQITVFDLETEEQQLVTLQSNLYQAEIYKDKLCTTDGRMMYVYDLMNFSLQTSVDIHLHKNNNPYMYIANFFVNEFE